MNRKNILKAAVILAGTLILPTACDYDDALHNTPHPWQGVLEVHTDYTSGTYYLRAGDYRTEVPEADYVIPDFFDPGTYTFVLFNLPQGMTEQGGTLTIDPLADGTLTPQPGTLCAASTQAEVLPDDTLRITLPMPQRTRQLTLRLTVTTGDASRLSSVDAHLTGIAQSFDVATLTLGPEPADVKPVFTREGLVLTAPLNLLGVLPGETQTLTVTLTNHDGQSQTLGYDLTSLLADFNTGTTPVTLDADLQLMEEAGFDFTITGWTDGGGDSGDAG